MSDKFITGEPIVVASPPGINTWTLGSVTYLVSFHVTFCFEHVDGTGGSSEKNELIGEGSGETQLESDELPTVLIEDTYTIVPVPRRT